jgi:hypothetical protein
LLRPERTHPRRRGGPPRGRQGESPGPRWRCQVIDRDSAIGLVAVVVTLAMVPGAGLGLSPDGNPTESIAASEAACERGSGEACQEAANRYAAGSGVEKDLDRAALLYQQA